MIPQNVIVQGNPSRKAPEIPEDPGTVRKAESTMNGGSHITWAVLFALTSLVSSPFHLQTAAEDLVSSQSSGGKPMIDVPPTATKPAIDGSLNDERWKDAPKPGPLESLDGKPSKGATHFRLCCDSAHLYIAVTCGLPGGIPKDAKWMSKEGLEFLIDTNRDGNSYYLFGIHPDKRARGSYVEVHPPWRNDRWWPECETAVKIGEDAWTAELSIGFESFANNKTLASEIGFNIRRFDVSNQQVRWTGDFSNPGEAGILKSIPPRTFPDLRAGDAKAIRLGPNSAHPGTTGEVTLEFEGFLLSGDPHARAFIWDLAVDDKTGELYVLSAPRRRACCDVRVFNREGEYLRTIIPFNPTLPHQAVSDLCARKAVEAGVELVVPKLFEIFGAVEPSLYGEWWHLPQKLILAPNGDLIMSNIYRGTVWRIRPDGSLPLEGWTSIYNPERNAPFENTVDIGPRHLTFAAHNLKNYLPHPQLCYPYMCFDKADNLYLSRGLHFSASEPLGAYAYTWEVAPRTSGWRARVPDSAAVWWKMSLDDGVKLKDFRGFLRNGEEELAEARSSLGDGGRSGRGDTRFYGQCGLAMDESHLILADSGESRLLVFKLDGSLVASVTHYNADGKSVRIEKPTALAIDKEGCMYVLVDEDRAKKLVKLKSWQEPELLSISQPLHGDAFQIALDKQATPPLVWIANGAGWGTLLQLAGDDLSLRKKWEDTGETPSSPSQYGYLPILNTDPETGHIYFEDDSHYRHGSHGAVYRLDQAGQVLKTWEPVRFFTGFPWGEIRHDKHFRYPDESLFLDSLFAKDGRIYRWRRISTETAILRFDRTGKPVPFRAMQSHVLPVDVGWPGANQHRTSIHYRGMDVDRHGNIYYVNSRNMVDVYDADGNVKKKAVLSLYATRAIQVDEQGNIYALCREFGKSTIKDSGLELYKFPPLALCKFAPSGGKPLWSRPWKGVTGRGDLMDPLCVCLRARLHQAFDGKGYLYAAGKFSIKVIDCTTGTLVGEFGSYGNMDCGGKGSRYPHPELPFGTISALAVCKDRLFAVDALNRRIVKCRIRYGSAHKTTRQ